MDTNELKLIVEISKDGSASQRALSERTDLSLGMVNLILKRLILRGYVKSKGLSAKKMEYFLTPKGFSEKVRKSYSYIFKTIDLVKTIQNMIKKIILDEYGRGARDFVVLGEGSLADQVALVLLEMKLEGLKFHSAQKADGIGGEALILITDEKIKKVNGNPFVNIAEKLADKYWGVEA
jgi:DNA-binding MarR family transcriptional regulator